jgi:serine/threonine-protein kinase
VTDAKVIGGELGVDSILNGRITSVGDSLSIHAELISTADNSVIWGEQFTRKFADVERLQADIAEAIAKRLRVRLKGGETGPGGPSRTVDPEAYRLTLLGRYHLNKLTDEGFWKGRDYFERAIELDPEYAPAHAGLAEAYNRLSGWNAIPPHDGFPKSRAEAEKAIALDSQLSAAHGTLGMVKHFYDWDWQGAEREFKRAIEINPNDADVRQYYSYHLSAMGRFDESLAQMKQALALDPLSLEKNAGIGEVFYLGRNYDGALEQYTRALEMDANSGFLHWAIGNVYNRKGMYAEAIAAYQKAIPLSGESLDEPAALAHALALSGKHPEARAILKDLQQRSAKRYISPTAIAVIYSALGEKDLAFASLEKAYERRDMLLVLLKAEPVFDGLRDDPRFTDLVRRVGLPQ